MLVHRLSRITVAFVWIYHGLAPKILGPHQDEINLAVAHGLPADQLSLWLNAAGIAEVLFGIVFLIAWTSRWPFVVSIVILAMLLVDVAVVAPQYLVATFNPVSVNISVIVLSIIGFITARKKIGENVRHTARTVR